VSGGKVVGVAICVKQKKKKRNCTIGKCICVHPDLLLLLVCAIDLFRYLFIHSL
jgi:hypothetical protein